MASPGQEKQDSGKPENFSRPQDDSERAAQDAPSGVNTESNGLVTQNKEEKAGGTGDAAADDKGKDDKKKDDTPEGGYDATPIPKPPPGTVGYTLKFTFHRATSLTIGDVNVMSSDPYVFAQLNTGLPQRHKEDPALRFRGPTVRRNTDPTWDEDWVVANVPSTGFKLKVRVYDEDPADHDDMLGKIHITVDSLTDDWPGIKNQAYKLTIRDSSKRALFIRSVAKCFRVVDHIKGDIYISIESLGRTEDNTQNGKAYTVGPCRYIRHYSPLLGRLTHTTDFNPTNSTPMSPAQEGKQAKNIQKYNFQANELQLAGPVPAELYHRFVEFKPWVKRMFTLSGFQGAILGKALHHQHNRVYNFDRTTVWGSYLGGPSVEMTKKFLELVHWDQGGRIFTYVLTLDALWRFTETGKEFGIDMLSKHTMHSDVSIYIAFSGEFFIHRLKHRHRPPPPDPVEETSQQHPPEHAANEIEQQPADDPPTDPSYYELVIDNDSGTYRPNAKMLPILAKFLAANLPGLHIQTLDCQADADKMDKMKTAQRERKKREGDNIVFAQGDGDSISSSEDERLDDVAARSDSRPEGQFATGDGSGRERGTVKAAVTDAKRHGRAHVDKWQRGYRGKEGGAPEDAEPEPEEDAGAGATQS